MKKVLVIVVSIIVILIGSMIGLRIYTKSHSPFEEVSFNEEITVKYCRPFKNEREVFGALVPYGKVWRTGANEATVFSTIRNLKFGGEDLTPGEYSLWTIPGEESWTVILNSEIGQWGVNLNEEANRDPSKDVLSVETGVIYTDKVFEQFTITLEDIHDDLELVIVWDKTMVIVPVVLQE